MKHPAEQMAKLYAARPDMNLQRDIQRHIAAGYFIATPTVIGMIRRVKKDWPESAISEPLCVADDGDCWFIWLLCGSLREAVKYLPYPLPWFGFCQRGSPPRFVEAEKVLAKLR